MEDEINRLRDMLAQLSRDQQKRVVPKLIGLVEWFSEAKTDTSGDWTGSRSITLGFSTSRRRSL